MKWLSSEIQIYRILIGTVVLYLAISIGVGDFFGAAFLIILSIICTAGLGGLIWFPLSWLTGFIVIYLFNSARRKSFLPTETVSDSKSTQQIDTIPVVSHDVLAITQYILKSRKRNASDSQITNRLKQTGWSAKEIELAFAYVGGTENG